MKLGPSQMFKVLGAETRVKIIELLKCRGPLGAKSIAEACGITPAAVSQHLKVLRLAGLVRNERHGYWIPYSIDEEALENCCCVLNEVCTCGSEEPGRIEEREVHKASLASLMEYKEELEKELQKVQERISQIRTKKK